MGKEIVEKSTDKRKRGRPSKAEKHAKVTNVVGPLGVQVLFEGFPGDKAMPHEVLFEGDIEDRFKTLGTMVEKRLKEVVENAEKDRSEIAAEWTPWLTAHTPEDQLLGLARRRHLNERVLNHMLSEVASHMILGLRIDAEMKQARRAAIDHALRVPRALQEFIVRLHVAGLKTASVKDMPLSSIEALVALINGDVDPDVIEMVGIARSGRRITDEEAYRALEEADRHVAEHEQSIVDAEVEVLPAVIEPVVPDWFDGEWDYSKGPLPPEFWSTVQDLPMPYVWEYRMVRPEEEDRVLGMVLPEAHSWAKMIEWDRHFKEFALETIRNKKGASLNLRDYMGATMGMDPDDVDANVVKTWLLLLAARLMTEEECDRLFEPGFFEGVVMPCPATGAGVVRQLVPKGE